VLYMSDEWTPTWVVYDMYPALYPIRVCHLPGSWIETVYEGYTQCLHGPCMSVVGLSVFLGCVPDHLRPEAGMDPLCMGFFGRDISCMHNKIVRRKLNNEIK